MKYQLAIIGGGPAGYTAAEMAGKAGLSVVLFEKNNVGGVCLNEGCIPTKTLLYAAKVHDTALHASKYGVNVKEVSPDLGKIIARKRRWSENWYWVSRQSSRHRRLLWCKGKLTFRMHILFVAVRSCMNVNK